MANATDVNSKPAVLSAIALGTLGVLSFIVQPALVHGFVTHLGLTEPDAVNLAGLEMLGVAIATILLALPRQPMSWRTSLVFGLALAIAGNMASALLTGSSLLWIARLVAGLGHGVVISLSFTFIGLTARVDRNLAWYLVSLLSYGAIGVWFMPGLLDWIGISGLFSVFALLLALGFFTVRYVPESHVARTEPSPTSRQLSLGFLALALLANLSYNMAQGIAWAILFLVGIDAGLGEASVAQGLFASQILAIFGALGSVYLVGRLPRGWAVTLGIFLGSGCIALLLGKPSLLLFVIAICGFNFLWNLTVPFMLGAISDFDKHGRMMGPAIAMQMIGLGTGPLLAAQLIGGGSYRPAELACIAFFFISYILLAIPMLSHRQLLNGSR